MEKVFLGSERVILMCEFTCVNVKCLHCSKQSIILHAEQIRTNKIVFCRPLMELQQLSALQVCQSYSAAVFTF